MRVTGRANPINGNLNRAARAVLKADRHGQPGSQFAVHLALGRPCPNRAPRHQIGGELRRDRIQELTPGRHPHVGQIEQQAARRAQPLVNLKLAVQIRIVNQPFPANRRAGFLKIHPHDNAQPRRQTLHMRFELPSIIQRRLRVVNRTRPGDHHQAIVPPANDISHLAAGIGHRLHRLFGNRQLFVN